MFVGPIKYSVQTTLQIYKIITTTCILVEGDPPFWKVALRQSAKILRPDWSMYTVEGLGTLTA